MIKTYWGFLTGILVSILLTIGIARCSEAHDWHLWDTQKLTSVRMQYCEGYMLVETKELGILLIEKTGNLSHSQLHVTKVDEYECVYNTEPLTLDEED